MQQIMPQMMDASSHTSSLMLVICMDSAQVQMLTLTPYKHFWLLEGGGGGGKNHPLLRAGRDAVA